MENPLGETSEGISCFCVDLRLSVGGRDPDALDPD